jgi:hypothetical protein
MSVKHPQTPINIPPGRLVQGSTTEVETVDRFNNNAPLDKPRKYMGIAVPKTDPTVDHVLGQIYAVGVAGYQSVAPVFAEVQKWLATEKFSWKVEDGDHPDNAGKEGFAGCWIFKFGTTLLDKPACCDANQQPIDPALIKRGYYVDGYATCQINGKMDRTAGVYLNPVGLRLLGPGVEIQSGPSFKTMFGDRAATLPAGAVSPAAATPATPTPGAPIPPPPVTPPGAVPPPPAAAAPAVPAGAVPTVPPVAPPTSPVGAPANASLSNPPAGAVPQPGFSAGVPPAPPPPPPAPPAAPALTPAQIAAQYGVTHYPGHRYDPATNAYVPDAASV